LHVGPVIHEMRNWDARSQFSDTAVMVAMPVSDDQVINPGDAGVSSRRQDSTGIAHGPCTTISGIDQERLTGWGDSKRGVAAFDVDNVDIQGLREAALARKKAGAENNRDYARESSHSASFLDNRLEHREAPAEFLTVILLGRRQQLAGNKSASRPSPAYEDRLTSRY
jgi:hypothetical protein